MKTLCCFKLKAFTLLFSFFTSISHSQTNSTTLIPYRKGDKWGYADKNKKILVQFKYDDAKRFIANYAIVKLNGKYGFINKAGKEAIPPKYDRYYNFFLSSPTKEPHFVKVVLNEKQGVFDMKNGREIIAPEFDFIGLNNEFFIVEKNSKKGLFDTKGKQLTEFKYKYIDDFFEGLARVELEGMHGFIDKTGREVIAPKYTKAYNFSDGLAAVRENEKWIFIDKTGKTILSTDYTSVGSFSSGLAYFKNSFGKYGFMNKTGKVVIEPVYDDAFSFDSSLARIKKDRKWGLINTKGEIILEPKYTYINNFVDGLAKVSLNNKYGFIDTNGKEVVPVKYDDIDNFSDGLAKVELDKKYGFVNKTGTLVVPITFDKAFDFRENKAAVCLNKKWGYINSKGQNIIPMKYDEAYNFENGIAFVRHDGNSGYIDDRGGHFWDKDVCKEISYLWLNDKTKLNYEINYETPFDIQIKKLDKEIDFTWFRNNRKGFDLSISEKAMNDSYKMLNHIYNYGEDSWLYLNDATSVFCSRKLFDELKKNKSATCYPYAKLKMDDSLPITFKYKGDKTICIKNKSSEIALKCLEFEAETGEKLVILDNPQYPLIVQMILDFHIYLKSME